jgi:SAM-dependent methyltransferase
MHLSDIVDRVRPPEPWAEGDNIPWHEPRFSARMLREHLSQAHDAASRRREIIDRHVAWIFGQVLGGQPGRVLDLGCGPGLYAQRLAALGCACTGVDFSPASIEYARTQAQAAGLACTYHLADLRQAEYGAGYDLAMLLYGEPNVFAPDDLRLILRKAWAALRPGGQLLLEPHTLAAVEAMGREPAGWSAQAAGLFADGPHLLLSETFWDAVRQTATLRYYVLDTCSGEVTRYAQSMQGYTEAGYRALLEQCGFGAVRCYPALHGEEAGRHSGLFALAATRSEHETIDNP